MVQKKIYVLGCIVISSVSLMGANVDFGLSNFLLAPKSPQFAYISHSSFNIGDDIQSIAVKRFLPANSIPIDREFVGAFKHPSNVNLIVNGWYMHTKDFLWCQPGREAPEQSWPPSPAINPLILSIHFTKDVLPYVLSDEGVAYLKKHAPIGARDHHTLMVLLAKGIPAYFSGCVTLTLENDCKERNDIIYAVDLEPKCIDYIRAHTKYPVEELTHNLNPEKIYDHEGRLGYTQEILELYKRAKCVVTTKLHATMPCLAFKTPVLLINSQIDQYRFDGIRELVRNCYISELLAGKAKFNFDEPGENPQAYLPLRNTLIMRITSWVKSITHGQKKNN